MLQLLESQGWSIKPDAYKELVEEAGGDVPSVLRDIFNVDLKRIGKPALPDDINRAASTVIKGPHILQISAMVDVSRPSSRESSASDDRLLCIRLSDGKTTCKAVEYGQRIDALHENLPPGTKVILSNATVKSGIVLLKPQNIKVRGMLCVPNDKRHSKSTDHAPVSPTLQP